MDSAQHERHRNETIPQPVENRIALLDVLRAFALLGIYVSIIHSFNGSVLYGTEAVAGPIDRLVGMLESLLINKRFIGLLSLLFGLGIAIQQQNFQRRDVPFEPYFLKRMLILACLGLVNTTFYFNGEILLVYAVFGCVTLALSRLSTKAILAIAVFFFLIPGQIFEVTVRDRLIEWFQWFRNDYPPDRMTDIYRGTDFVAMIKLRWLEYAYIYTDNNFHLAMSLAMILFGYWIGKRGYHHSLLKPTVNMKACFAVSAAYSVLFSLFALATGMTDIIFAYNPVGYVFYAVFLLTSLITYIGLVTLVFCFLGPNQFLMKAMANNGRLCLTGYMGGALVYSFLFYGFGLGLYMKVSNVALLMIALAAYTAFTALSWAWLTRFKRGPMEWILRRLSYGQLGVRTGSPESV